VECGRAGVPGGRAVALRRRINRRRVTALLDCDDDDDDIDKRQSAYWLPNLNVAVNG